MSQPAQPIKVEGVEFFWKDSATVSACEECEVKFTFTKRKHHCRACGGVFCDTDCSKRKTHNNTRICIACYDRVLSNQGTPDVVDGLAEVNALGTRQARLDSVRSPTGELEAPNLSAMGIDSAAATPSASTDATKITTTDVTVPELKVGDYETPEVKLSVPSDMSSVSVDVPGMDSLKVDTGGFWDFVPKSIRNVFKSDAVTLNINAASDVAALFDENKEEKDPGLNLALENTVRLEMLKKEGNKYETMSDPAKALLGSLVLTLWIGASVVFFNLNQKWDFSTALYYSIQAGMTVGFADISTEDTDTKGGYIFTIGFLIIGALLLAYAFGHYVVTFLEDRDNVKRFGAQDNSLGVFNAVLLFFFWVGLGVVYGMLIEDWSFLESLYFAISTMSTAGLAEPGPQDSTPGRYLLLLCAYVLTGVPVFFYTFSQLATREVQAFEVNQQQVENLRAKMEYTVALNEYNDKSILSKYDFLRLALIRSGAVNRHKFAEIEDLLKNLEEDESGKVNKIKAHAAFEFNEVAFVDTENVSTINAHKFVAITDNLQLFNNHTNSRDKFKELDAQGGKPRRIDLPTFLEWYVPARTALANDAEENNDPKPAASSGFSLGGLASAASGASGLSVPSMPSTGDIEMGDISTDIAVPAVEVPSTDGLLSGGDSALNIHVGL